MSGQEVRWPLHPTIALPPRHPLSEGCGGLGTVTPTPLPVAAFVEANEQPGAEREREEIERLERDVPVKKQERTVVRQSPSSAALNAEADESARPATGGAPPPPPPPKRKKEDRPRRRGVFAEDGL